MLLQVKGIEKILKIRIHADFHLSKSLSPTPLNPKFALMNMINFNFFKDKPTSQILHPTI